MASPNEITVPQLLRLIGTPDCPVLIDVRIDEDYAEDPYLIPGALRFGFSDIEAIRQHIAGRKAVVYCQKGLKLSQGLRELLRTGGLAVESLQGGQFGWRDAGAPMVTPMHLPPRDAEQRTLWVTRHRPKIDRIACPWLIRRFLDPSARFLFVEPSQVLAVAEKFDATPFDIEDVFWTHRGAFCTFDTMISEFGLKTDALDRLAAIVRGADTNALELAPQAAGLMAACLGLSRMYRDDQAQLEAGLVLMDAFYRWARDAVDEGHDWPAGL